MALRHQTLSSVNGLVVSLKPNGDARWAHLLDLKGSGNEGYSIVQNKDTLVMVGCSFANIFGTWMYNMVVTKLYLSTGNVIPNSTIIYNKQSSRAEQGYSAQLFKTSKGFLFNFTATFWASKNIISEMQKKSKTFRKIYEDMDKRKEHFIYVINDATGGKTPSDLNEIRIGINHTFNSPKNPLLQFKYSMMAEISHETGHKLRQMYKLDPVDPTKLDISALTGKDWSLYNTFNRQQQERHEVSEVGALFIENIVLGELIRAGYKDNITLQPYYSPGFQLKFEYDAKKELKLPRN